MDNLEDKAQKAAKKLAARIGNEIRDEAFELAPKDTGKLRDNIKSRRIDAFTIEVGNTEAVEYAPHVHYGTGIYGKHKKPITPKNARALKTPWGYSKSVKGQEPNPYLDNALKNYRDNGGLDRALADCGQEITKSVADSLREAFKRFK